MPTQQNNFPLLGTGAGTHEQIEAGDTAHGDTRRGIVFMHPQAVPFAKKIVTFAINHLTLGLARLLQKLRFLPFDPAQLVDHRQAHGFIVHHQRGGHPNPAMGRIDAQMQVFLYTSTLKPLIEIRCVSVVIMVLCQFEDSFYHCFILFCTRGRKEDFCFLSVTTHLASHNARHRTISKRNFEMFTPLEFIAAITPHIPERFAQMVRHYGWYSNRMRGDRQRAEILQIESEKTEAENSEVIVISNVRTKKILAHLGLFRGEEQKRGPSAPPKKCSEIVVEPFAHHHLPDNIKPKAFVSVGYYPLSGASSTSRTLRAKDSGVYGFWRKAVPASSTP